MKKTIVISLSFMLLLTIFLIGCSNSATTTKKIISSISDTITTSSVRKTTITTKDIHEGESVCPYCNLYESECVCEDLKIEKKEGTILTGTIYETKYYIYKTNKEGPGIAIVGGIHGDEVAGWTAALTLLESIESEKGIRGTILILPQASILADTLAQRYPGRNSGSKVTTYNGIKYSDLNRSFNEGRYSSSTEVTITISDAITALIKDFDDTYGADYIIDLHEASKSWDDDRYDETALTLGNTLIYSNLPAKVKKIIKLYNEKYRLQDETKFTSNEATQKGSFSIYHTVNYPDSIVFTIETNRDYYSGVNHIELETRVRIQLNMLEAMFDYAWGRN